MNRPVQDKPDHADCPPKPILKKMRWPYPLIWAVPLLAAIIAGYYVYLYLQDRGPLITIKFTNVTGLKTGESHAVHLGVQIGEVKSIELSPDKKQALVQIRLKQNESEFARKGSLFWIVRPEISMQEISGLATVISGPIIDSIPGNGEPQSEFTGLDKSPSPIRDGLSIILQTPDIEHLQADSPIYYRGIQVGFVQNIQLASDSTGVDIRAMIQRRYAPLIKANSQFWVVSAVDVKGGVFTGLQMKVESLRSLLSGAIAFATPEEKMGEQAQDGRKFILHDESQKEWLTWSPKISIEPEPDNSGQEDQNPRLPQPSEAVRSTVGSK